MTSTSGKEKGYERTRTKKALRELYGDGFSKSRFSFTRGVVASIAAAPVATATIERTAAAALALALALARLWQRLKVS